MKVIWAEVTCEIPSDKVEQLADFLVTLSGNGVCIENLDLDTFSLEGLVETPIKTVKTYFISDSSLQDKIEAINEYMETHIVPSCDFALNPPTVAYLREEDWANNWKKHFRPLKIGRRVVIKPTWEEFESNGDELIIHLDPGMAFGTGAHPTSRLCLETIERIFTDFLITGTAKPDLLDVGTGSGVLAIAAAKLGADRVVAVDIDPGAVVVAKENIGLNGVNGIVEVSTTPLREVHGDFSVVVANIQAEDLVRMAGELVGKTRPGGYLILSGILMEREESVLEGFAVFSLDLMETAREGEWCCITYRKKR
jgi:ribosomal protein L11 methyltransferase